jgi:hypothetical protein
MREIAAPAEARRLVGPEGIVGTFGGSEALLPGILKEPADYLSIGPVFATTTKQTTKAPIGVEGVRKLRKEAGPDAVLVAVGGVTLENRARGSGGGSQRDCRCCRHLPQRRSGGGVPAVEERNFRVDSVIHQRQGFLPISLKERGKGWGTDAVIGCGNSLEKGRD